MTLKVCSHFYGRRRLISTAASIRHARDVVFVPFIDGKVGGLFEPSGRAVPESIAYVGTPHPHTPHTITSVEQADAVHRLAGGADHIFIGDINPHYGHFLVGALARLWSLPPQPSSSCRIVFSSLLTIDDLMRIEFFAQIINALSLSRENLLRITEPTFFREISVPATTFEELSLVHEQFATLLNRIGKRIIENVETPVSNRLVYMSKERLTHGVLKMAKEEVLTERLSKLGVDIVFPEQLSLKQQILLWNENPIVIAYSGSSLHTSAFLQERRMLVIAHSPEMWVNQVLIDMANRNRVKYVYDDAGVIPLGPTSSFTAVYEIRNPDHLAADIVRNALSLRRPNFRSTSAS